MQLSPAEYQTLKLVHEARLAFLAAMGNTDRHDVPPRDPEADKPVSVADAAQRIGCSASKVRALVKSGHLTPLPGMGHAVYIVRASLDAYLRGERS